MDEFENPEFDKEDDYDDKYDTHIDD